MDKKSIERMFKKATLEDFINEYGQEQGMKEYQEIEKIRNDYSRNEDLFGSMFSNPTVEETFIDVYGEELGTQKFDEFVNKYGKIKDILSQVEIKGLGINNLEILEFIYRMKVRGIYNVFLIAARIRNINIVNINPTFDEKNDLQQITTNLQNCLLSPDLETKLGYENTTKIKEAIRLYSEIIIEAEKLRFFAIKGLTTERIEEFRNKKLEDFKANLATVQNTIREASLYVQYTESYNPSYPKDVYKGIYFGYDHLQMATKNLRNSRDLFNLNGLKRALEKRISIFEKASTEELREFMINFYLKPELIEKYNKEFAEISKKAKKKIEEVKENFIQAEKEIPQESVSNTDVDNKKEEQEPKQADSVQTTDKAIEELERKKEMLEAFQKFQREFTQEQRNFIINQYMNQMLIQEQRSMENNGQKLS